MTDEITVSNFVTKQLVIKEDNTDRFFEGILSVEIKDRQGEITDIDELYKALPIWMERNAPMSDTHSNRIVGRGINFEKVTLQAKNGEKLPAIKILGKIHSNTALDDFIWKQIVDGTYKGLSFGGATKANRIPVPQSDGTMAYRLKDLEIYEVAVCEDPAVAFALITDVNPLAKAVHVEKDGEELKAKCDGTSCYINAEVRKADMGTPIDQDDVPKEVETHIGEAKGYNPEATEEGEEKLKIHMIDSNGTIWYEAGKDIYGQDEEDFPETDLKRPDDKTKPLPTKYGKMEFAACEAHAKKDPSVHNAGGYCGSIQQHVDKDTKVHAGQKEYSSTESCISGEGNKDDIRDAEAYCGSRHNNEHGMNPNAPKHKADHVMGSTGVGNQCDEKASCSEKPDLSETGVDEVAKPDGDRQYFKKSCGCSIIIQKDIVGTGTENPRGLGAYNTSVNGTGGSNQVTSSESDPKDEKKKDADAITPEKLGDPTKLGNKPTDPIAKKECEFEKGVRKYWEENKNTDNNSELHLAIKDYIENYKEEPMPILKAIKNKAEEEWVMEMNKFSTSAEGIAQYGDNVEVSPEGHLVNGVGNIIFINPFI